MTEHREASEELRAQIAQLEEYSPKVWDPVTPRQHAAKAIYDSEYSDDRYVDTADRVLAVLDYDELVAIVRGLAESDGAEMVEQGYYTCILRCTTSPDATTAAGVEHQPHCEWLRARTWTTTHPL